MASFWLGLAIAIGCTVYGTWVRFGQLDAWRSAPDVYYPGGVPAATELDAYYWLRWAQSHHSGTYQPEADDALRRYQDLQYPVGSSEYFPDGALLDWRDKRQPKRLPLLSWMLSTVGLIAGSVEYAGLYLVPVLANLFLIPVFIYGWRIGYPAAGLMGGLIATFSIQYYARTSPGWIDTDCLNLLFPWVASLLVLCMSSRQRRSTVLLLCAALGVTLYLHFRWYEKPAIAFLYWGTLVLHLALQRIKVGFIVLCLAICVVFSHPLQAAMSAGSIASLASRYLFEVSPVAGTSLAAQWFPDVMRTIAELQHGTWEEPFAAVLTPPFAAMVGALAFAVLAVARWRQFVPLLPLLAIAALALGRGLRFAMYLAPFVGMGLGALVELAVRGFLGWSKSGGHRDGDGYEVVRIAAIDVDRRLLVATAVYGAVLAVFFVQLKPMTGIGHVGKPAVPGETAAIFRDLKRELEPGTPVWTWWDYGYAIPHISSLAVYHDGGVQHTPQTHVIANSLVIADQAALRNSILFVDRFGNKGIESLAHRVSSREELLEKIGRHDGSRGDERDILVLFTAHMIEIVGTMRYVAGLPVTNEHGELLQYEILPCGRIWSNAVACDGFDIDLSSGAFSDGRTVGRLVFVNDGRVVRKKDFPGESSFVLQVLTDSQGQFYVLRLPDEIYRSNFNRMFLLGEFDPALFDEVYRRYPMVRIFRLRR